MREPTKAKEGLRTLESRDFRLRLISADLQVVELLDQAVPLFKVRSAIYKVRYISQIPRQSTNGIVRIIYPSNLTVQGEIPTILGKGTLGCVKKVLYCSPIDVAVKVLKGDANERHFPHKATAIHEIEDHPGGPFLYGVCKKFYACHGMLLSR